MDIINITIHLPFASFFALPRVGRRQRVLYKISSLCTFTSSSQYISLDFQTNTRADTLNQNPVTKTSNQNRHYILDILYLKVYCEW